MDYLNHKNFDVVIIGGGLAGLSTALTAANTGLRVAVVSKTHPLRSQSVGAQGGIAARSPVTEKGLDNHIRDTIEGGAGLCDRDAVEYLCNNSNPVIEWLNSLGVPFSRERDNTIARRVMAGHRNVNRSKPEKSVCYCSDHTGLSLHTTLWEKSLQAEVAFFNEYYSLNLLMKDSTCFGVSALNIKTGTIEFFTPKATVLATGGAGSIFKESTNPLTTTGDGLNLVLKNKLPLQDMEFIQFHPTALFPNGQLISEAVRGAGGVLLNENGASFMDKYSPEMKNLAERDIISRAIFKELQYQNNPYVNLDLRSISRTKFANTLPGVYDLCCKIGGINPQKELIPVKPAAHYTMGGIPVSLDGRVLVDGKFNYAEGLFAVGECACLSVHGANRLGGNSLLETVLFGKRCGNKIKNNLLSERDTVIEKKWKDKAEEQCSSGTDKNNNFYKIRDDIKTLMSSQCGIIREKDKLIKLNKELENLSHKLSAEKPEFRKTPFNTLLIDYLETLSISNLAKVIAVTASKREESRGAHFLKDYSQCEENYHSLYWHEENRHCRKKVSQ